MQIKKIALAVAFAAAAAASASAADIQIYGRVDSGLRYENMSGKDDSLSMTNNKSAPRIGFNIKERSRQRLHGQGLSGKRLQA